MYLISLSATDTLEKWTLPPVLRYHRILCEEFRVDPSQFRPWRWMGNSRCTMSGILHAVVAAKERPTPDEILRDARGGQPEKLAALRAYLSDGICWYLRRSFGQHDVDRELVYVLDTIAAIVLQGHVGSGDELTSLTRIAVLTTVEQAIASGDRMMPIVQSNKRNVELMKQALIEFSETEREALSMHCEGWPIDRICALTGQTEAKFAEFRSRLKTRYAQLSCYESTPVLSRIVISSRSKPN